MLALSSVLVFLTTFLAAGLAVLIGWFTAVSMTLAAFDVPADAVGLDQ